MVVQFIRSMINSVDALPKRFERKYYLPPSKVNIAFMLLRNMCLPDGDFPAEQINSLYFDTTDLDQHQRSDSGDRRKDKIRIRWYGDEKEMHGMQTIFIEVKSKEAFESTKQRRKLQVPAEALSYQGLVAGIIPYSVLSDTLSGFGYFPPGLLQPVIKVSYFRNRYADAITGQRVSLDSHIRSTMIRPGLGHGEKDLELAGAVIEIKGNTMNLPVTLKQLKMLGTDWSRFSKYSGCIDSHLENPGTAGRLNPSGRMIG